MTENTKETNKWWLWIGRILVLVTLLSFAYKIIDLVNHDSTDKLSSPVEEHTVNNYFETEKSNNREPNFNESSNNTNDFKHPTSKPEKIIINDPNKNGQENQSNANTETVVSKENTPTTFKECEEKRLGDLCIENLTQYNFYVSFKADFGDHLGYTKLIKSSQTACFYSLATGRYLYVIYYNPDYPDAEKKLPMNSMTITKSIYVESSAYIQICESDTLAIK